MKKKIKQDSVWMQAKKRGSNGKYKFAKSLSLEDFSKKIFVSHKLDKPPVCKLSWFDLFFKTKKYKQHLEEQSLHLINASYYAGYELAVAHFKHHVLKMLQNKRTKKKK